MRNFYVNEGNTIASQDAQPLGVEQAKITASAVTVKGQCVAVSGNWKVAPTTDLTADKYLGIAFLDAEVGDPVSVVTEGFVKLTCSGAITAGESVVPTEGGKVKTASGTGIGIAVSDGKDNKEVYVKLR